MSTRAFPINQIRKFRSDSRELERLTTQLQNPELDLLTSIIDRIKNIIITEVDLIDDNALTCGGITLDDFNYILDYVYSIDIESITKHTYSCLPDIFNDITYGDLLTRSCVYYKLINYSPIVVEPMIDNLFADYPDYDIIKKHDFVVKRILCQLRNPDELRGSVNALIAKSGVMDNIILSLNLKREMITAALYLTQDRPTASECTTIAYLVDKFDYIDTILTNKNYQLFETLITTYKIPLPAGIYFKVLNNCPDSSTDGPDGPRSEAYLNLIEALVVHCPPIDTDVLSVIYHTKYSNDTNKKTTVCSLIVNTFASTKPATTLTTLMCVYMATSKRLTHVVRSLSNMGVPKEAINLAVCTNQYDIAELLLTSRISDIRLGQGIAEITMDDIFINTVDHNMPGLPIPKSNAEYIVNKINHYSKDRLAKFIAASR